MKKNKSTLRFRLSVVISPAIVAGCVASQGGMSGELHHFQKTYEHKAHYKALAATSMHSDNIGWAVGYSRGATTAATAVDVAMSKCQEKADEYNTAKSCRLLFLGNRRIGQKRIGDELIGRYQDNPANFD